MRLAYEVGESKADGGESRISGTSLDDMRNNVAGIDFAYRTIFADALKAADAKLADTVASRIEQLKATVAAPDLPHVDIRTLAPRQRGTGGRAAGRIRQARIAAADAGGAVAMMVRRACIAALVAALGFGLLIAGSA